MVIAAHRRPRPLFCLLASLICQTHERWEALVVHSGAGDDVRRVVATIGDPRIQYHEVPRQEGDWGAHCRTHGFGLARGDWIGTTNDDNYYAPVYFTWMVSAAKAANAAFVYCNMVHSITNWSAFNTSLRRGYIDAGGWLCKGDIVKRTPWPPPCFSSDGEYAERLVAAAGQVAKVDGYLFVHN